jgi:CheY-like chemotaxis protein
MARVLIADDNPAVRRLLELRLLRLGHEPLTWAGEEVDPEDIDLLIVEPAGSAPLALARELRSRAAGLPIVISSIRPRTLETARLRPTAHLLKPFALSRLQRALDSALEAAYPLARAG